MPPPDCMPPAAAASTGTASITIQHPHNIQDKKGCMGQVIGRYVAGMILPSCARSAGCLLERLTMAGRIFSNRTSYMANNKQGIAMQAPA